MSWLGDVVLLRPWWLAAVPLVLLLAWWQRADAAAGAWRRATDPALLAAMARLGRLEPARAAPVAAAAALALVLALALSGPASRRPDSTSFRHLDGVVLVLDLSPSMTGDARLGQVRTVARRLLGAAGARPVAVVLYAGDAYLARPFTVDARLISETVAVLDADTIPDRGSRPERALALAGRAIEDAGLLSADVVLIADGGGLDGGAWRQAQAIAATGGRVFAVGLGTDAAGAAALARLAAEGGGEFAGLGTLARIGDALAGGGEGHLERSGHAGLVWRDHGRPLLVLALPLALLMFRRAA